MDDTQGYSFEVSRAVDPFALRAAIGKPTPKVQLWMQSMLRQAKRSASYFRPGILDTSRWSHARNTTPGIDLSQYNYEVDAAALKKAGVQFVILRCSVGADWIDPTFAPRCQQFYDVDMPVFAYHVFVPNLTDNIPGNTAIQMANMRKALEYKQVYALWIDNEIVKDTAGKVIAPYWIESRSKDLIDTCKHEWDARFNGNIGMYFARWVVEGYAPNITNWAHLYKNWLAQYPYSTDTVVTTWEELDAKYYPAEDVKIWLPGVVEKLDCWQFSGDKFKLPGIYANSAKALGAVDLDLIPLPFAKFCETYNYTPRTTPAPDPDPEPNPNPNPEPEPEPTDGTLLAEAQKQTAILTEIRDRLPNGSATVTWTK